MIYAKITETSQESVRMEEVTAHFERVPALFHAILMTIPSVEEISASMEKLASDICVAEARLTGYASLSLRKRPRDFDTSAASSESKKLRLQFRRLEARRTLVQKWQTDGPGWSAFAARLQQWPETRKEMLDHRVKELQKLSLFAAASGAG